MEQPSSGLPHAAALGALAAGAVAVGSLAIGALAIGRLAVKRARIGALDIDELSIRRVRGRTLPGVGGHESDGAASMTASVADAYVALCRRGEFDAAMERFFSPDHVRLESRDMSTPPMEIRGLAAIRQNSHQFSAVNQVHEVEIDGPLLGTDRFAVSFKIHATSEQSARRAVISKVDLYTVQDGRIARSEVYYGPTYSAEG